MRKKERERSWRKKERGKKGRWKERRKGKGERGRGREGRERETWKACGENKTIQEDAHIPWSSYQNPRLGSGKAIK